MIKGLYHIGVVVRSIDETMSVLEKAFGAVESGEGGRKTFPEIGQTSALVRIGDFEIELMEPYGDVQGACSKFLEKRGEGLHHISLISDNLDADDEHLASVGIHVLGKAPKDYEGDRVMFTHPKETGSIVFEITQLAKK
jgi:methylmalonyl-CoA/ethylmalonyl-CoA epimerase